MEDPEKHSQCLGAAMTDAMTGDLCHLCHESSHGNSSLG
jgi:hypothetical protein